MRTCCTKREIRQLRCQIKRMNDKLWNMYDLMLHKYGEEIESLNVEFLSKAISALGTLHYSLLCTEQYIEDNR